MKVRQEGIPPESSQEQGEQVELMAAAWEQWAQVQGQTRALL
jgi:hypothetical protein